MKKTDKPKKEQKPQGRTPKQPKGVVELGDQALEQVQGGAFTVKQVLKVNPAE